ncbi:alpha/beta hydrolase family protein [Patulibacter sp.]|uniref:alpha/beta hydrolase n=1 Tax=Patulibacter sp. TaxID=1912859 RepID=UPI002719B7C1|nr:alpha/beta hydrolase-fold protein [Patulibacter sp.]MDO9409988.1 alpha/beta hydrolase-fold protein [Patulibacter sp.]
MASPGPTTPRGRALRRAVLALLALFGVATVLALVLRSGSDSDLPPVTVPTGATDGTAVRRYDLRSTSAGRRLVQTVVLPPGDLRGRPLLVFLHARAQDPASLAQAPLRAALARLGDRAPVVLLPADDGGSYWHDRDSGSWGRYVLYEAIPTVLRRYGLDGSRMAIGGISMGGAGAFALARDAPGRFCAVGGHSAALWSAASKADPGAYDDAEDFARNEPVGPVRREETQRYGVPLWLDVGTADRFLPADREFARLLRSRGERVAFSTGPGGHEPRYWQRNMGRYLDFYAGALADCGPRDPGAAVSRRGSRGSGRRASRRLTGGGTLGQ